MKILAAGILLASLTFGALSMIRQAALANSQAASWLNHQQIERTFDQIEKNLKITL